MFQYTPHHFIKNYPIVQQFYGQLNILIVSINIGQNPPTCNLIYADLKKDAQV